jgi:hypothetical protein
VSKLESAANWLGAGTGVGVPALTFFENYTPPLFPQVGLLLTALSGALLYVLTTGSPKAGFASVKTLKRLSRQAVIWIGVALVFMIVYVLLLHYCTVMDPQKGTVRFQIGFGTAPWSLTESGRKLALALSNPSPDDLMMAEGAYVPGGPETIWSAWSTLVAGMALILSYMAAFIAWTTGFGLLIRHRNMNKDQ